MSDRPLNLLLVDSDPIFRLGLKVALEAVPNLQVVADVENYVTALQRLAEVNAQEPNPIDLVVAELGNSQSIDLQQLSLQFFRQLRASYPHLPILLLSSVRKPEVLLATKESGVHGYIPKGKPVSELVFAIRTVASGSSFWQVEPEKVQESKQFSGLKTQNSPLPFTRLRNNLRFSGIGYIEDSLAAVTAKLQTPGLPILERAILAGQRRELLAASWLLNHLLASSQERQQEQLQKFILATQQQLPKIPAVDGAITQLDWQQTQNLPPLVNPIALQSTLFSSCVTKLQYPLKKVTDVTLEIDILREDKKRELLYLILKKLAQQLDELRNLHIEKEQLPYLNKSILIDLWQSTVTDFFGKFSRVKVGNKDIEIVNVLLQDSHIVQRDILNKIPLFVELLSYLLFPKDLEINSFPYTADSAEANSQALIILENLLIQIANSTMQPLLNYLADVETIKQNFYDYKMISTREIERFRNNLSWKYRWNNYVNEAQAIFESRYDIFVIAPRGIAKTSIYAPRSQELAQLSGIPLAVTLLIEFRDAIAPRLQSLLGLLGNGIVFVLTQIVGRGLGLIGRGILQGIGSASLIEKSLRRNSERTK